STLACREYTFIPSTRRGRCRRSSTTSAWAAEKAGLRRSDKDRRGLDGNGAMTDEAKIERLGRAIKDLHGFSSTHVQSVPIHETFKGKTVWEGVVEVFQIHHHKRAGF